MYNFCLQCGKKLNGEREVCSECAERGQPQSRPNAPPYAPPRPTKDYNPYQTRPLDQSPMTQQIQPFAASGTMQTVSQCPHCGGAGGIYTKTDISTAGYVYMGIMLVLTLFFFMLFFPCAIIPFGLLFLGFLFKEKHFACVNCGNRVH
ncbi:MAG: hypothetical protein R2747_06505 [Pyrinomonadaceae bacterium]